jgi:serpin B
MGVFEEKNLLIRTQILEATEKRVILEIAFEGVHEHPWPYRSKIRDFIKAEVLDKAPAAVIFDFTEYEYEFGNEIGDAFMTMLMARKPPVFVPFAIIARGTTARSLTSLFGGTGLGRMAKFGFFDDLEDGRAFLWKVLNESGSPAAPKDENQYSGLSAGMKSFAAANNEFAASLYKELRSREDNLFLSPYSIRTALALAYVGARGRTAHQMAEVLRLPEDQSGSHRAFKEFENILVSYGNGGAIEIDIANALWKQEGFKLFKEFSDILAAEYASALFEADFIGAPGKACRAINRWVSDKTRGRIREIVSLENFDALTRLVLANAIYFSGKWKSPFGEHETSPRSFQLVSEESHVSQKVTVPMMKQKATFGYAEFEGFQALEMPYAGNKLSMVIFLPATTAGWIEFEKRMSAPDLSRWIQALSPESVNVHIPKFQFDSLFDLTDALEKMGMGDAFKLEQADFSGMTLEKPFGISRAIHKAMVEVDEAGTRAAAATLEIMCTGLTLTSVFTADHPFIFVIRDVSSGAILFMGRVLNPAASA